MDSLQIFPSLQKQYVHDGTFSVNVTPDRDIYPDSFGPALYGTNDPKYTAKATQEFRKKWNILQ